MSVLDLIVPELEYLAISLSSVMDLEITVVDTGLKRLVGTGRMKSSVGRHAPEGSAFSQCLRSGRNLFVEEPRRSPICRNCTAKAHCTEQIEFCIPLRYNGKIIGVLGMCAFTETGRAEVIKKKDNMLALEQQLSRLVTTMLREREFESIMEYHSSELMTLMNSITEGVLIINRSQEIITANKTMFSVLNMPERQLAGARFRLNDIFSESNYAVIDPRKGTGQKGPIRINGHEYLVQINRIDVKSGITGHIMLFSSFEQLRLSVHQAEHAKSLPCFSDIIGESPAIVRALQQAKQAAEYDIPVMIVGQPGTGKELFAQAIHRSSSRSSLPFTTVSCNAITADELEADLFGIETEAYPGGPRSIQPGRLDACRNGTLFLSEISVLTHKVQRKLMDAVQNKIYTPVGSQKSVSASPRIISTTSHAPEELVKDFAFRNDLFYSLTVLTIFLPPLKERGNDIILLARHFLEHYRNIYEKDIVDFNPQAEEFLLHHPFPGNIRQLRSLIERAVVLETENTIRADTLKAGLRTELIDASEQEPENLSLSEMTARYEKKVISDRVDRMRASVNPKKSAAESLGISLATLYRKLGE